MGVQHVLYLFGRYILTASYNHVIAAPRQIDIALVIHIPLIAGVQPAILGQGFSRLLGVFPVSAHHPRPLGNYLAYLAQGQLFAVLVRYLYLHVIHRLANRHLQPLELLLFLLLGSGANMVLRPQAGYSGGSLGLTEGIDKHDAGEYIYRLFNDLEWHGGSPVRYHLETG